MGEWLPIESAPKNRKRMFVVRAIDQLTGLVGGHRYTSDPYCVWSENGKFIRWPHDFPPTHWTDLPDHRVTAQ